MPYRDLYSRIAVSQSIAPQVISSGAVSGTGVDLLGHNSAMVVFNFGAVAGSGVLNCKVQESADNSTFTDVAAADLEGSITNPATAATVQRVGYKGASRYIRAVATLASGTSVACGATVDLGRGHILAEA
jgi:hypothetical protein